MPWIYPGGRAVWVEDGAKANVEAPRPQNNAQGSSPAAVAAAASQPFQINLGNLATYRPDQVVGPVGPAVANDPTPGGPPAPAVDPNKALIDALNAQVSAAQAAAAEEARKRRANVFDTVSSVLKQYGIDSDGTGLSALVRQWAQDDKSADWIKINLRDTTQYKSRFPAMQELIARGQAIDEMTYIAQEKTYRAVLQANDLPEGFYDGPEDYARFIANDVSAKELSDRVVTAKTFLDANTDPAYKNALQTYFGISEGGMLAYVLDGDRAQATLQKQLKAAQFGGAAGMAGFELDASQAERYGATLGSQYDSFGSDARLSLQSTLSELGSQARNDERIAGIDRANEFAKTDVLDAALMGDGEKKLASQARNKREAGRFSGRSAITEGTLSRQRGI
jgi:hypothetical protein